LEKQLVRLVNARPRNVWPQHSGASSSMRARIRDRKRRQTQTDQLKCMERKSKANGKVEKRANISGKLRMLQTSYKLRKMASLQNYPKIYGCAEHGHFSRKENRKTAGTRHSACRK